MSQNFDLGSRYFCMLCRNFLDGFFHYFFYFTFYDFPQEECFEVLA